MARCLIVGCGCRGLLLAERLRAEGHVIRATTRRTSALTSLELAGVEPVLADPDRIVTIFPALDHVGVVCVLLGSAEGSPEQLEALHGTRLEMLMLKVLDTTVRGVVYEAAGSADPSVLASGAEIVARLCGESMIPFELLERAPAEDYEAWATAAAAAVARVMS